MRLLADTEVSDANHAVSCVWASVWVRYSKLRSCLPEVTWQKKKTQPSVDTFSSFVTAWGARALFSEQDSGTPTCRVMLMSKSHECCARIAYFIFRCQTEGDAAWHLVLNFSCAADVQNKQIGGGGIFWSAGTDSSSSLILFRSAPFPYREVGDYSRQLWEEHCLQVR